MTDSIWDVMKGTDPRTDKIGGALRRVAELRKEANALERELINMKAKIAGMRDECREIGVGLDFELTPAMAAAIAALDRPAEPRDMIQLSVTEVPIIAEADLAENQHLREETT